ncbi:hypothetical protein P4H42_10800 [Paenibacillus macerans]|uniref:hypothetical protein n=1 Tax=Paenibacillus macerans TaxID=44252 RepID=UPI002DBC018E|nr:hypothetical protein [Paenibacillus macerans]MEC0330110.1 hypothetical protein [Paenibacillus macerans]
MAGKKGTAATKAAQTKATQTKAVQETAAAKAAEDAVTEKAYPLHELMAVSETLLGVKPEVLAGAVAGARAGVGDGAGDRAGKEMMQVEEAKRLVKQFLGKKVL